MTTEQETIAWVPRLSYQFDGSNMRLGSVCGERRGRVIATTGQGGALVFGPYLELPPGSYQARIWGTSRTEDPIEGLVDATIDGGKIRLDEAAMVPSSSANGQVGILAKLSFTLNGGCPDLEIRIWVNPQTDMVFHRLDVRQTVAA